MDRAIRIAKNAGLQMKHKTFRTESEKKNAKKEEGKVKVTQEVRRMKRSKDCGQLNFSQYFSFLFVFSQFFPLLFR